MLSSDGRRLAVTLAGQIWVRELDHGPMTQLTFEGGFRPEWTPDGSAVAYLSDRDPPLREPFIRPADGTGAEQPLFFDPTSVAEFVFSPDGRWIAYRNAGAGASDLWAMRRDGDTTRVPLVTTPYQEAGLVISPDSRWLAYVTLETGRAQVRVRPFPNTNDGNWLVSPNGGTEPAWAKSGRELFYRDGDGNLVSVPITPGPTFVFGEPRVLFSASRFASSYFRREYAVAPDDQRFIFVRHLNPLEPDRLVVIENVTRTGLVGRD